MPHTLFENLDGNPFNTGLEPGRFRTGRHESNNANNLFEKTAPAEEPVTLVEAKDYIRVDGTDEDTLITSLIIAARECAERITRRAFITTTFILSLDKTPNTFFVVLPRPPLLSIVKIESFDDDDAATLFAATNYTIALQRMVGKVVLKRGVTWPTDLRRADGITIEFTAGYGAAADVPGAIKTAILRIMGELYEHREDAIISASLASGEVPFNSERLLRKYKVPRL